LRACAPDHGIERLRNILIEIRREIAQQCWNGAAQSQQSSVICLAPIDCTQGWRGYVANGDLYWITDFIWDIAGDALRDLYVRGRYRDVILPMMVQCRLDAVLELTKPAVQAMKENLDKAGITGQGAALRQAPGQAFYNTSRFALAA